MIFPTPACNISASSIRGGESNRYHVLDDRDDRASSFMRSVETFGYERDRLLTSHQADR